MKRCSTKDCSISTGIHGGFTFGSGKLDFYGYWQYPCDTCARAYEEKYPEDGPAWPFKEQPPAKKEPTTMTSTLPPKSTTSPESYALHDTHEYNAPRTQSCGCQISDTLGVVHRCEYHTATSIQQRNKERQNPSTREVYFRPYGQP